MRKIKIVLEFTVEEHFNTENFCKQVNYLFADAFAEFQIPRKNPEKYVNTRYPIAEYTWMNRDEKIHQVYERVQFAKKLHDAGLQANVSVLECDLDF